MLESSTEALFRAIEQGQPDAVRAALQTADPNAHDAAGVPALVAASRTGRLQIVELLLDAGADVTAPCRPPSGNSGPTLYVMSPPQEEDDDEDDEGEDDEDELDELYDHEPTSETALEAAIRLDHVKIVQRLLDARAPVRPKSWDGTWPLELAAHRASLPIVEILLGAGADPTKGFAITPLHVAAARGSMEVVEALLAAGAEVDAGDEDGATPLMSAADGGHLPVVKRLLEAGADINVWSQGDNVLTCAVRTGDEALVGFLRVRVDDEVRDSVDDDELEREQRRIHRQTDTLTEGFIDAAMMGKVAQVRQALDRGVDVNALGSAGQTALHYAVSYGHMTIVELLLGAGADPNAVSDEAGPARAAGSTPLHAVAGSFFALEKAPLIARLLEAGADINARDDERYTPLFIALVQGPGYPDAVEALANAGADLDLPDEEGTTPLMMALAQGNEPMVQLLRKAGASERGVREQQLIRAAEEGDLGAVERLIAQGADVNHSMHGSALSGAAGRGHTDIVRALVAAGADLDQRDSDDSFNPLLRAAYRGHLETTRVLVEAGADLHVSIKQMGTALDYARLGQQEGNHRGQPWAAVIELLERAGTPSLRG